VKFFSGIATYTTTFDLPAAALNDQVRCLLQLGNVYCVADVTVNGKSAGIAWERPYAADVTGLLKPGRNELTIAVTNTWVNRLIGDEFLPPDAEYSGSEGKFTAGRLLKYPTWWNDPNYPKTRQRISFPTWRHYTKESPLVPSGLVGPVTLQFLPTLPQPK
jgi:hypothetical protein